MQILAVGDIHLGRVPGRLPAALTDQARELGPAGAWARVVEGAIEQAVDAVVFAGDLVDREHDFYEAYRELGRGVERLVSAGIRVLGVSGNHDVRVLPRLAERIDGFELLGAGGVWQARTVEIGGEPLTLHGWSFADEQVRESPLRGVRLERGPGINLGVLHCDRDQAESVYAPVTAGELAAAGLDGWLLGHIHAPDALGVEHPRGYLGSIGGLSPGEPGDHGPWLVTIDGGRLTSFEQWTLAPLRWHRLALDVSAIAEPAQARTALLDAVQALDSQLAGATTRPPLAVALRLRLTGRTRHGAQIRGLLAQDADAVIHDSMSTGARYFIERLRSETRPAVALDDLAARRDPPGLLARRLLLLDDLDNPERDRMLSDAAQQMDRLRREARWRDADAAPIDEAAAADWLRRAGTRLLEAMLAQQSQGPA